MKMRSKIKLGVKLNSLLPFSKRRPLGTLEDGLIRDAEFYHLDQLLINHDVVLSQRVGEVLLPCDPLHH